MFRGIALFCALAGAIFGAAGATYAQAAPQAVTVHIVNSANDALAVTTIEPRLSWPLVLQRSDKGEEAADVEVNVTHLLSTSGRSQQLVLQRDDGSASDGRLTLPAGGQAVLHAVADVPEEGLYKGEISLLIGGKRSAVAFNVTRAVREVAVVGATGGALQMATPDPGLRWPVVIRRNDNAEGARNVMVELGNLIAPSGRTVAVELRNGDALVTPSTPITLQPLGQVGLTLVGKLPEEGLHNGEIGLVVDGKRFSTVLKITRNLKDSAVRIEDIAQTHTTLDHNGIRLRLRLQEAEEMDTTVDLPTLVKLDRKESNTLIQANYEGPPQVLAEGKPLSSSLTLHPHQTLDLALLIKGLTEPGNYAGVLRVSSPTRKQTDKAFELSLRRGMETAIVLILLGVILSTLARLYYTVGRSAIIAQGDAITVRDDLTRFQNANPDLVPAEQSVLAYFLLRLEAVRRGNADPRLGTAEAQVDEIRRKIEVFFRWIELRRKLDAVKPKSIGDVVRAQHQDVRKVLVNDGAAKTVTDQALADLQTYATNLDNAVKAQLNDAIAALQNEIATLSDAERLDLRGTIDALARARSDVTAGNIEAASTALTTARHAYVQTAIKSLKDSLDPKKRALGFTQAAWEALVSDYIARLNSIQAETDAEQKVRDWDKLRIEWLQTLAEALLRDIDAYDARARATTPPATPDPAAPDPVTAHTRYEAARTALKPMDSLLLDRKFQDAGKAYDTATQAYMEGRAAMKESITLGVAAGSTAAPAPNNSGEIPDTVMQGAWNEIAFVLGAPTTAAEANKRVMMAEGLLFLLMVALALVIGLKFLYFDNAAWGTLTDMAVAFLWGFGLHQVGGTAFQGVQGIAQQIVGK